MLSKEEKQRLALTYAKYYIDNNLSEYEDMLKEDSDVGKMTIKSDLAAVYLEALKFYDEQNL